MLMLMHSASVAYLDMYGVCRPYFHLRQTLTSLFLSPLVHGQPEVAPHSLVGQHDLHYLMVLRCYRILYVSVLACAMVLDKVLSTISCWVIIDRKGGPVQCHYGPTCRPASNI